MIKVSNWFFYCLLTTEITEGKEKNNIIINNLRVLCVLRGSKSASAEVNLCDIALRTTYEK